MVDRAALEALANMVKVTGVSIEELAEHIATGGAGGLTVREFYGAGLSRTATALHPRSQPARVREREHQTADYSADS